MTTALSDYLKIDLSRLHEQCAEQPELLLAAGERAVTLRDAARRSKLRLDVTLAEGYAKARKSPEEYGMAKPTEAGIEAAVTLMPDVQAAQRLLADDSLSADEAQILVTAFEHRKAMLRELSALYLGNYWSEPDRASGPDRARATEDDVARTRARRMVQDHGDRREAGPQED